eukprot:5176432-Pleurochrysis_carterae.AAC.1
MRTCGALAFRSPSFGIPTCAWPPPPAIIPTQSRLVGALSPAPAPALRPLVAGIEYQLPFPACPG